MITFLRDLIFSDFWLKLFSFGLAVLIWFTINMAVQKEVSPAAPLTLAPTEQRVIPNLPVIIMSSAEDVRSFRVNPKEVEVTVQGDLKILNQLQNKDIRVLVDLSGIGAAHDLRKRIEVSTPAGVTHVRVEPEEVQVIFPAKD
jgi:YbbR domain-containing protein